MKRFRVKVIPRASCNQVIVTPMGDLKVKLMAPPVEGKANEALLEVLAEHFQSRKSSFRILSGASGRNKIIEWDDLTESFSPAKQGRP
jgi:uncharacterized protein (TIGR00251 family)